MSGFWGNNIRLAIFGESHGEGIGIVIDGLPCGMQIDHQAIQKLMERRAPGGILATPRLEADKPEYQSGIFEGRTTGAPLCAFIRNTSQRSSDYYTNEGGRIFRPGHADYTGYMKYNGYNDFRGGGHFSGRVTAALVLAGALSMQALSFSGKKDIQIAARIASLGGIDDEEARYDENTINKLKSMKFPVISEEAGEKMKDRILKARAEGDSVGGVIECCIYSPGVGLGEPFFGSIESVLSGLLFSIPAVKGVEFGEGFGFAGLTGSRANDSLKVVDARGNDNGGGGGNCCGRGNCCGGGNSGKAVVHMSNRSGGINGGISNGMPIIFRAAVRPTPSIFINQDTVCIDRDGNMTNVNTAISGRHDSCILPRAIPVVEAAAAIAMLELLYARGAK